MASLMDLETDIDLPSKRDVDIGRNVGQFWYIIREHIICSQLLFMPGMAASKKATEIDDLGRHGKHLEAADMFLAELKDLKDPGKWESFLKVLKDEGFEYMAEIIEGTVHPDTESAEAYKQLIIEVFGPVIRGKLDAMDLAPSLLEKGLIDNEGMQKLQARNAMDGNLGAVNLLLLSLIWRKKKNWLDIFLQILIENSEEDLAKLIDEKKCAKIKDQLKEKSLRGLTSARENVMFGGGSTFEANPYLCPPSASGGSVTSPGLIGEAESDERTRLKEVMLEGTAPERQELPDPSTQAKRLETEEEEIYRRPVQESGSDGPESFAIGMKPPAHHDLNDVNRNTGGKPPLDDKLTEFNNLSLTSQDEAEGCGKPLKPRKYQLELAELALQGKNVIICAPTNTGKTIVAIKIIQEHLKKPGIHKVAFIVDKVALAGQQFDRCRQYLSPETRIKKMIGEAQESPMPLGSVLQKMDVIIMTAQILVNALKDPESGIRGLQDFTLLIFDECHHTMDNHPYNQVMVRYIDRLKLADSEAPCQPQVVGLTASVGVGKARSQSAALQHIKHLCANMDAVGVVTVRENKEELAKYTNIPPTETLKVSPRVHDEFRNITERIMTAIEDSLQIPKYFGDLPGTMQSHLRTPPRLNRAEDQYVQWLSMLDKLAAQLDNNDARRFIFACHEQLKVYNSALMLNEDCRTKDAMQFLKKRFESIKRKASFGESTGEEARLLEIFDKHCCQLEAASHDTTNPKLDALEEIILETFKEQSDSRAILFVKTRELTAALVQWMEATEELQSLKPAFFTGAQAAADKGGMTQNKQTEVLARFRAGEHRVLVATSVAEEGLDISSCNLVVCYGYNTNVIGMMQIRGRARKTDSKFANVGSARSGLQDKVEVNAMQEILMMQALEELHKLQQQNPATFQENVDRIQKEDYCNRMLKEVHRLELPQSTEEYKLMCKCGAFVCMSSDIRVIHDCHRVAISEDFMDGAEVMEWSESLVFKEVEFKGKVVCRKCGQEWGAMMKYKNFDFPTIKIENVVYKSSRGIPDKKKKWKQVPFGKIPLTLEDQMMLVERLRGSSSE